MSREAMHSSFRKAVRWDHAAELFAPNRAFESITVRALANDVVIGLMAVTLARPSEADLCN